MKKEENCMTAKFPNFRFIRQNNEIWFVAVALQVLMRFSFSSTLISTSSVRSAFFHPLSSHNNELK